MKYAQRAINVQSAPHSGLVIWVPLAASGQTTSKSRLSPSSRYCWVWEYEMDGKNYTSQVSEIGYDRILIDTLLVRFTDKGTSPILWLPRGWPDFVTLGLGDLIDQGQLAWQYFSLRGSCVSLTGSLRGRPLRIASLTAWTGGRWDAWRDLVAHDEAPIVKGLVRDVSDPDALVAFASVAGVVYTTALTRSGGQKLTAAAQGRAVWAAWLGPRLVCAKNPPREPGDAGPDGAAEYVAPWGYRPPSVALGERHACHALAREQYVRGAAHGPVYCFDVRASYLAAILGQPIPMVYYRRAHNISPAQARELATKYVSNALVCVHSPDRSYPTRVKGRPVQARGCFWTWLCGVELVRALEKSDVKAVDRMDCWVGRVIDGKIGELAAGMKSALDANGFSLAVPVWRSLYSQFVGSYAQWQREWVECAVPHPFGRWSQWTQTDARTGEERLYRCIAGRSQWLKKSGEAPHAVPLLLALVTSYVRSALSVLAAEIGEGNVLAQTADALWLTSDGAQRYLDLLGGHRMEEVELRCKQEFSTAWFDGRGTIVGERDGFRYVCAPGIPGWCATDEHGIVRWYRHGPWLEGGSPSSYKGPVQLASTYDVARFLVRHNVPLSPVSPWKVLAQPYLPEALYMPLEGVGTFTEPYGDE